MFFSLLISAKAVAVSEWDYEHSHGRDPYEVLGVAKGAYDSEIKKAYQKMVRRYHPDVNAEASEAEQLRNNEMATIANLAYGLLKDPVKRANFDESFRYSYSQSNRAKDEKFWDDIRQDNRRRNQGSGAGDQEAREKASRSEQAARDQAARNNREQADREQAARNTREQAFRRDQEAHEQRARNAREQTDHEAREKARREQEEFDSNFSTKEPESWSKFLNPKWQPYISIQDNLLGALLEAKQPIGAEHLAYLKSLIGQVNWDREFSRTVFELIVKGRIERFNRDKDPFGKDTYIGEHQIDAINLILDLPAFEKFPKLMEKLITGMNGHIIASKFLTLPRWQQHPEFETWLELAISNKLKGMVQALARDVIPALKSEGVQKKMLRKLIQNTWQDSLHIIAEEFPLSYKGADFSSELRELMSRGIDSDLAVLAARFDKFLASPMNAPAPSDYYRISLELDPYRPAKPQQRAADPQAAKQKDNGPPKGWETTGLAWMSEKSYEENIVRAFEISVPDSLIQAWTEHLDWNASEGIGLYLQRLILLRIQSFYHYYHQSQRHPSAGYTAKAHMNLLNLIYSRTVILKLPFLKKFLSIQVPSRILYDIILLNTPWDPNYKPGAGMGHGGAGPKCDNVHGGSSHY